ncbi:MAG: hypothetical protein ACRDSH_07855 [Pseudonocardiaceae bacterium]
MSGTRRTRTDLLAAVAGAVVGGLLFLLARRALIDDAYISLDYARNVAFHLHWGVIEQQTSNTATSPLNVWLLAGVTALVRQPVAAAGVILMASSAATAVWSARTAQLLGLSRILPVLTVGGLLADPLLASTIGLETYLAASLIVGLSYCAVAARPAAAGVLAGLLVLTRPDLVVFAVVAVLGVAALRRRAVLVTGIAIGVALPWYLVSWRLLGSALPGTFLLKTGGERWGGVYDFANGLQLYRLAFPTATVLAAVPAALGVLCLAAWITPALRRGVPGGVAVPVVTGIGGLAHFVVFSALGTAPYHWYYGPSLAGLISCAAFTAAAVPAAVRVAPRVLGVLAAAPVAVVAILSAGFALSQGVPWAAAPITTNWALASQYQRIGTELAGEVARQTIASPGEIGTLAYYCRCAIVDAFSDRGTMNQVIQERERRAGPVQRPLLQINYRYNDRTVRPSRPTLILQYQPAQRAEAPDQWNVDSPWRGTGRLLLNPAP